MQPIIAHIDMNSYFATVEQQDNPAWRGQPVGVCEHLGGIIIAASVEAKRWGIKTGTPVWEARKLYPKIHLTKTHPDRYRFYTARFLNVFADYTDKIEKYSIDEAFIDLTKACNIVVPVKDATLLEESRDGVDLPAQACVGLGEVLSPHLASPLKRGGVNTTFSSVKSSRTSASPTQPCFGKASSSGVFSREGEVVYVPVDPWQEAARIANEIKTRMKTEVGDWIRCSAGISYSKFVAKIASDLQKPDGLVIVRPEDKHLLYNRLVLQDLPGIGRRMEKRLNKLGILTVANLRDYPLTKLVTHFGIQGYHLHSMGQLQGSWKEGFGQEVIAEPMKSIGHMYTVPKEFRQKKSVPFGTLQTVGNGRRPFAHERIDGEHRACPCA